jgi:ubiquinone/menaquinone biosynthesis C-methylase UbiE
MGWSTEAPQKGGVYARAAASYNAVGPRHFTAFARRLVDHTVVVPGDRVLDAGTGTGEALLAAAERCAPRGWAVGVDLSPAMLARAAGRVRGWGVGWARLGVMDAERLAFAGGVFDVALCAFALSSIPHPERALGELRRVLRPGGRAGVVDTAAWYFQQDARWRWHEAALRDAGVLPPREGAAPLADDRQLLATALRRAGFRAVRMTEAIVPLIFRDEAEWWRWSWSHGSRRLFESVPPAALPALKARLFRGLQGCRGPDGRFHGTMRAAVVSGQAPFEDAGQRASALLANDAPGQGAT